jgi:hypothetical protein
MDPNKRLTCKQLLEHHYLDKKRFAEMYDRNTMDEQKRRERKEKREKEREKNLSRLQVQYPLLSHAQFCILSFLCLSQQNYQLPQLTGVPHPPMTSQSPVPVQAKHSQAKGQISKKYTYGDTHLPTI